MPSGPAIPTAAQIVQAQSFTNDELMDNFWSENTGHDPNASREERYLHVAMVNAMADELLRRNLVDIHQED